MPDDRLDIIARAFFTYILTDQIVRGQLRTIKEQSGLTPASIAQVIQNVLGLDEAFSDEDIVRLNERLQNVAQETKKAATTFFTVEVQAGIEDWLR